MRTEHGKIEGNQTVKDELKLHGMIVGNAEVLAGGTLYLHGMIMGDLVVEVGGNVILHGMVLGNVTNNGGTMEIYGMICKRLIRMSGSTQVDENAKIIGGS